MTKRSVGIVGGTGPQGRGLAYRFAHAGHAVTIGSRDASRAVSTADDVNERVGQTAVTGASNHDAAAESEVVVLAVPWAGHDVLVESLAAALAEKIVISCVNPLGFDGAGPYGLEVEESAAQQVQRLVPTAKVVGGFHHLAAATLWKHEGLLIHEDILLCGDDADAKEVVAELARAVTGKDGLDAGGLRLARQLEPLTAVLIGLNKRYRTRTGLAITGLQSA